MAQNKIEFQTFAQPYTAEPTDITDLLHPARTAAEIADVADKINTFNKFQGRQVYDVTNGLGYFADGPAPDDTWTLNDGIGSTQVTPS